MTLCPPVCHYSTMYMCKSLPPDLTEHNAAHPQHRPTGSRFILTLRVKCSEQWLYLAVFLHLLPSWDLSPHYWWLTHIYPSPLCSPNAYIPTDFTESCPCGLSLSEHSVLMFSSATYLLLLVLLSPFPLFFPSGPVLILLPFPALSFLI